MDCVGRIRYLPSGEMFSSGGVNLSNQGGVFIMATDDMTREERLEYWGMVVDEFHQSGLTKTEHCQKNDIAVSTFNYWDNKLNDLAAEACSEGNRFVEIPVSDNKKELHIVPGNTGIFHPELSLLYNRMQILIDRSTPMSLLKSVLKELGYAE